jgi:hypothetical protein
MFFPNQLIKEFYKKGKDNYYKILLSDINLSKCFAPVITHKQTYFLILSRITM